MKNTIIDAVSAAPGWIAVYIQHMPSGEARLVPMHVALWVRIERANDDEGEGKAKQKKGTKMMEYRPHVAGRDGRIVDYRDLENDRVTYLIMATPTEEWSEVGKEAYEQLLLPPSVEEPPASPPGEAEAVASEPPPAEPN